MTYINGAARGQRPLTSTQSGFGQEESENDV